MDYSIEKALVRGHFRLSSGMHSDKFYNAALLSTIPDDFDWISYDLAAKMGYSDMDDDINLVVGPAIGGIILAYALAEKLSINKAVKALFTEKPSLPLSNGAFNRHQLRRGFDKLVKPKDKVLLCEDVISTGNSLNQVRDEIERLKGEVVGAACIIDRSGGVWGKASEIRVVSLLETEGIDFWPSDRCELCKRGEPLIA